MSVKAHFVQVDDCTPVSLAPPVRWKGIAGGGGRGEGGRGKGGGVSQRRRVTPFL